MDNSKLQQLLSVLDALPLSTASAVLGNYARGHEPTARIVAQFFKDGKKLDFHYRMAEALHIQRMEEKSEVLICRPEPKEDSNEK